MFELICVNKLFKTSRPLSGEPASPDESATMYAHSTFTRWLWAEQTASRIAFYDVLFTTVAQKATNPTAGATVVGCDESEKAIYHCTFYVLHIPYVDYAIILSYNVKDNLSIEA